MGRYFLPRKWRMPKLVLGLILFEFPFTVANLALFGIAAPNTYRTVLWRVGGEMGFNSDPSQVAYAAYNYQEMEIPMVWSSLNTNYNMYIGVVCTFFYLIKSALWLLHVFYPILSLILHVSLTALWAASLYIQTAPDTVDPAHQNKGAPWYITKSCNIVSDKRERGYCMQAKSAFAVSVIMLITYAIFIILSIWSLIPTPEARAARDSKIAERKAEKELYASSPYDQEMTAEDQWQHMWELQQLPRTPGATTGHAPWAKVPATPRTTAFNQLQGAQIPQAHQEHYAQPRSPMMAPPQQQTYSSVQQQMYSPPQQTYSPPQQTYFPPPDQVQHESVAYAGVAPQGQHGYDGYPYNGKGKGTAM
ncbi:hypothetical protein PMIN03_010666 [Paraphaeosphaeria minitans]|uniref:MARVEL domain-containing protein n=1 Tax=Paraphaeosphaeria minitans TaxID=565426 RepID=A0A9P6GH68_9PLEO|nr:hypothetical protein PMIN01_06749 [Paraphaeosphaeria minitans]